MPIFTSESNKDRLYLTLNYRFGAPGSSYHLSFVYAKKDLDQAPTVISDEMTDTRWHATNQDKNHNQIGWRYERVPCNLYTSNTLIARVLLAKFSPKDETRVVAHISHLLKTGVQVNDRDPNYSCVVFALDGLALLQREGLITLNQDVGDVSRQAGRHSFYRLVQDFGDHTMKRIQKGELDIARDGASAIPILDIRMKEN